MQCPKRGFGRHKEARAGQGGTLWRLVGLTRELLPGFSDSFLPRRWATVCNGSVMYGKYAALQCETGRRGDRGALRVGTPKLEHHPRDRMFLQHPETCDRRCDVYGAKADCLMCRAAGSCRMLDTDFGECTTGEVRRTPPPRAWVGRTGRKSRHRLGTSPWPLLHGWRPSPSATGAVGLSRGGDPILFVHRSAAVCLLHTRLSHVYPTKPVGLAYIHLWSTFCLMIAILPRLARPGR
jgi:hypothetical protein